MYRMNHRMSHMRQQPNGPHNLSVWKLNKHVKSRIYSIRIRIRIRYTYGHSYSILADLTFQVNILRQGRISNFTSTCQKIILNVFMDRHQRDVHAHVLRCQFGYYFREMQVFKDARMRLRWLAYSCAICDFCLHINPNRTMPQFLKHLEELI